MRIIWTQLAQGTPKGLGLVNSSGPSGDGEAWKKLIGGKPVAARLETLPENHLRAGALLTSVVFQSAVAALLLAIPVIFPSTLEPFISYEVTPVTTLETRVLLPTEEKPVRRPEAKPAPVVPVRTEVNRVSRQTLFAPMTARRGAPVAVPQQEAPVMDQTFGVLALEDSREPARPRDPVKTGVMAAGIAVPVGVEVPAATTQIQTGRFGDTRNEPGESIPDNRSQAVRLGSLDIPAASASGKTTGAAGSMKGAVANSGFGNTVIAPTAPNPAHEEVKSSSFAAVTINTDAGRPKNAEPVLATEPVVILEKPNPVYTDEARRLGIEGEVQVRAVFLASGSVNVVSISKGLGHGLDEAAMRAARQIRFKPARRDGQAVDFPATIRIVFQLAF